jgi:hypothetical protein
MGEAQLRAVRNATDLAVCRIQGRVEQDNRKLAAISYGR